MRLIIYLLLILTAITGYARQISPEEAQSAALEFLNSGSDLKLKSVNHNAVRVMNVKPDLSEPQPYYIFNAEDNRGFVIISGDDRAKKILGYSDRGWFNGENIPSQLKAMFDQYAKQLAELPESTPQDASWSSPQIHSEESGILLKTANWDQHEPFNLMTPDHCVTGCVPTAVAIIMRFHKWPETGLGRTQYELNGHKVSFDFDKTNFDWDLMPLEYEEGQYTNEQALEVSKAMYAAGNAVHAGYGIYETFANLPAYGMYRYLKYDIPKRDVVIQDALELCLNKFCQTVKSEIGASRPMLLDIKTGPYIDHVIVADGYDSQNYVHLNYGWGGASNGYYDPEFIINSTNYVYSNIRPDRNATVDREEILPDDGAFSNSNVGGSLLSGLVVLGEIKPNEDFGFTYHIAFPIESLPNFKLGLLHISSQGNIKDVLWSDTLDLSIHNGDVSGQAGASITKEIENDDTITLAYKKEETDEWHIIKDTSNAKASVNITSRERDYLHFTVHSVPGVDLDLGPYAIIEDQKDLWNYNGKIERCYLNLVASVNEHFMLGPYSLHKNVGCATISINGLEIGQIGHNYFNNVPIVSTEISDVSNFSTYLPTSIVIEAKKYLYEDMLTLETHVDKAGTLSQLITLEEAKNTRSLTLTGQININDLKFVENQCPFLQILDMSKADIEDGYLPGNAYYKSTKMLQEVKLPRNLKRIQSEAFMGASGQGGLRIIYVPEGVEEIGERAFMLGQITSVVMTNPNPINVRGVHDAPFRHAVIYVPKGSKLAYEEAGWGMYWNGEFYERKVIEYDGEFIPIESIDFSPEVITMRIGDNMPVNPKINPNNSSEQWTGYIHKYDLNDTNCATQLKDNNCIEAIREGYSLLTVNHSNLYAHMLVKVVADFPEIVLNKTSISLIIGGKETLIATVIPDDSYGNALVWSTSDESVATVDAEGNVTAVGIGKTLITVTYGEVSATCEITVVAPSGLAEIFGGKDAKVVVYTLQGLKLNIDKAEDLKHLAKGFYIINGKKIFVK